MFYLCTLCAELIGQGLETHQIANGLVIIIGSGRDLWRAYFPQTPPHAVREEYKLNRPDVGWYQIRGTLKKRNASGDSPPVDFAPFEAAYRALTEKLIPQVYDLGFLRV